MISVNLVIWLLFSHFIADFICQSDYVAINKSKDWFVCMYHAMLYTLVMVALSFIYLPFCYGAITVAIVLFMANGILHFIIDSTTSRINSYLWKNEKRHWFFVVIGVDQFVHTSLLLLIFSIN